MLTRLQYLLHETWLGLKRGGWMNWAAVSTVTVLLFLLGAGILIGWQLDYVVNQVGNQLEVAVFLQSGIEAESLQPLVEKLPGVTDVELIPKEISWANLIQELGVEDIPGATAQLNGNPLVDEIRVQARSPEALAPLVKDLRNLQGIDQVRYLPEVLQQLTQLNVGLNRLGIGIVSLLTLASLAVITTTIRLIVIARREEIEIMQLVGATSRWISLPFVLQGLTFGLAGGASSWILLQGARQFLATILAEQPLLLQSLMDANAITLMQQFQLPAMLLSFGGVVGIIGSLFAVQRLSRQSGSRADRSRQRKRNSG